MATAKKIHSVGHVAKRAGKPTEVVLKTADSEATIRASAERLDARLKLVLPKEQRVGQILATSEESEILNEAANLDRHAADLERQAKHLQAQRSELLAPLSRKLDSRNRLELVGTKYLLRFEATDGSVSVRMPGGSHRLREVK